MVAFLIREILLRPQFSFRKIEEQLFHLTGGVGRFFYLSYEFAQNLL